MRETDEIHIWIQVEELVGEKGNVGSIVKV